MPDEPQCLYLTTTGRRTGTAREIEIWFTRHEDCYYVIAELGERAQWVQNLITDSRVTVRVGDEQFSAQARLETEAETVDVVRRRSEAKYGWGDGLVVALTRQR